MTPDAHPAVLEQAALELRRAVVLPGPQPQWHRSVIARHRAEWPTLWRAIDQVLAALDAPPAHPDEGEPEPPAPGGPFDLPAGFRRQVSEGFGDVAGDTLNGEPDPADPSDPHEFVGGLSTELCEWCGGHRDTPQHR